MRRSPTRGAGGWLLAIIVLGAMFARPTVAAADTDLVLLIDVSTSMRGLFPEARERVYQEIEKAETGDRVVLITFGERAHLLARRRVRGPADRAYLRALVQGLEPVQRATYLTKGLDRGFQELLESFELAPDRTRRMIWMSDDKNNPPASLGEDVFTLSDLREQNAEFEPEGEWFTFDAPIGDEMSGQLAEFLEWARRTLFLVQVQEPAVDLGTRAGPGVQAEITVHFTPQHAGLAGLEFLVLGRVSDPEIPGALQQDLAVSPKVVKIQSEAWAQTFTVSFDGPPGDYGGFFVFESYARTNFRVDPERIPVALVVEEPILEVEAPEVGTPERLTEIAAEMLEGAARAPGAARAAVPLEFGPVEPGGNYGKVIKVSTTAVVDRADIRLETRPPLPQGFALTAEFTGTGQEFDARLQLVVSQTAAVTQMALQGGALESRISFATDYPEVSVQPVFRDVLVRLDARNPRWGRRLLPPEADLTRTAAERLTFEELGRLQDAAGQPQPASPSRVRQLMGRVRPIVVSPYLWGGVVLAGVAGFLLLRLRTRPTVFFGELVVIKDPNPRKMRDVNLRRVATATGHDPLTLGSDSRADIRLSHESVHGLHARIIPTPVGEETVMTLQAARDAEVKVNDQVRTERVRLNDKDLIAIGDFIFLFSSPQPQRRVIARFLDGSVLRGTPLQWDITANSFQLLLDEPGDEDEMAHVDFGDLKAVFFVQEEGESAGPDAVRPERLMPDFDLEVEFQDGEKLAGHALSDYTENATRFYIVPKDDPSVVSVLIERPNTRAVVRVPRTDGPAPAGGWVRRFFSRS